MRKKRYYIIGIAGVAMASLAGLLKKKGYEVAGSDQETYEPMKSMLEKLKIKVFTPYSMFHVKRYKPDVVVVGNAIGRGNQELEYVLSNGHFYRSLADVLKEEFIEYKKAIVISGTHGKTTTTALVSWILECAGLDPTIFVGGFMRNINSTFKLGKGEYIILEGDEYDTAFFDKGPKFWHYRPFIGLINNIELDHVDIFKDLDAVKFAFARFINLIPNNGLLVVSRENKNAYELATKWSKSPMVTFGLKQGDYMASDLRVSRENMTFMAFHMKRHLLDVTTGLTGKYNVSNILGAIAIARFLKIPMFHVKQAIATFQGVKRRGEILGEKNGITVISDYAHHPTAVRETLNGLKLKFSTSRLIAVFEPGSASSKRRVFESEYVKSLSRADIVYLYKPFKAENMKQDEVFDGHRVSRLIAKSGAKAKNFEKLDDLMFHVKHEAKPGDVIVIMSCRGFDGLPQRILEVLQKKQGRFT